MLLDKCEGNQKYLLYFLSILGKKDILFCSIFWNGLNTFCDKDANMLRNSLIPVCIYSQGMSALCQAQYLA